MSIRAYTFLAILSAICGACNAAKTVPAKNMAMNRTAEGVLTYYPDQVQSAEAWYGHPFKVGGIPVHPTETVPADSLKKWAGQQVAVTGEWNPGRKWSPTAEELNLPMPISITAGDTIVRGEGIMAREIQPIYPVLQFSTVGEMRDYEWAHRTARLALTVWDSAGGRIYILDAVAAKVDTIDVSSIKDIDLLAWLDADRGFIVVTRSPSLEDPEDQFYRYLFAEKQVTRLSRNLEILYANVFDVVCDDGSAYWAAASVGEGHPDVAVYKDSVLVLTTDVYPGYINVAGWKNKRLYCYSNAWLELGLTRTERDSTPNFTPEMSMGRDNDVLYEIDPERKKAQLADDAPDAIMSFDQKFRAAFDQGDGSVTVRLFPTGNAR